MTRDQFLGLRRGQILYHPNYRNADGTPVRWRVSGKMQGSVRTGSARYPVRHGLWDNDYFHINDLEALCLTEEEALRQV